MTPPRPFLTARTRIEEQFCGAFTLIDNQATKDEYKYKYSGGMATYPQQHEPIAIYSKEADKTFFVYGGTTARSADDKQELLHMISYYDHKTGQVPRLRLHTRYGGGKSLGIDAARCLFFMTSADGLKWNDPQMLAGIEFGDYQVSWRSGKRVATAFGFHPRPGGLNARAN